MAQASDRKLIETGVMSLEVESLSATIAALQEIASTANGFVADSDVREGTAGARSGSVTLRIPAVALEIARAGVRGLGRVLSSSSQAVDVTREYVDLQTRIDVKSQTVVRLEELLTRTGDLEDLLAVERELDRAVTELESQKGQLQYMERQVSLSTLTVELVEPGAVVAEGMWKPVTDAFAAAGYVFAQSIGIVIYLFVSILPWVVAGALMWLVGRRIRRRWPASGGEA